METTDLLKTETDRIEWKETDKDSNVIIRAVCALANDLGNSRKDGYLVIGVRKDGTPVGVHDQQLDNIQTRLNDLFSSTKILPTPAFDIDIREHAGKWIVVVRVKPYPVPPVVTVNQTAWVRKGSVTTRARDADLLRLRERRPENLQPFDLRIQPVATLDDLNQRPLSALYEIAKDEDEDRTSFPGLESWLTQQQLGVCRTLGVRREGKRDRDQNLGKFEANSELFNEDLRKFWPISAFPQQNRPKSDTLLGRADRGHEDSEHPVAPWRPNPAALLVFGKDPQSFFPGAIIEFVRYDGTDIDSDIALRKTIAGTLPDQLDMVWMQLGANLVERPVAENGMRLDFLPDYPMEALKELARNMVQHRLYEGTHSPGRIEWYSEHIVFRNPGGPFGHASEGAFGEASDYRNPTITGKLAERGYVQRLGRGIRRVRNLLAKNGNPELEVKTDGYTEVVVRARS